MADNKPSKPASIYSGSGDVEEDEEDSVDGIKSPSDDSPNERLMKEPTPPGGIPREMLHELEELDKKLLREVGEFAVSLAEYRRQIEVRQNRIDRPRPEEVPKKAFIVTKTIRDTDYLYWQWHDDELGRVDSKYIERVDDTSDAEKDVSPDEDNSEPDAETDFEVESPTPTSITTTNGSESENNPDAPEADDQSEPEENSNPNNGGDGDQVGEDEFEEI